MTCPNPVLAATLLLAFLAGGPAVLAQHETDEGQEHADLVILSPAEQAEFGIVTIPAAAGLITHTRPLPAEIRPNDDRLAHIVPRYEGIVTEVLCRVGDQVKVGQTLALVEGDASLAVYPLQTRISGTVISKHITRGEAVDRESVPFVIADLDTVWLDIHVYQRDLDLVRPGQTVFLTPDPDHPPLKAVISYVSPVVDEASRTALARAVLPNPAGRLRPGLFVTALVETGSQRVPVAVPESALFQLDGRQILFISDEDGFEARPVATGAAGGGLVEITSGLEPGELFVAQGGFTLKAELEKAHFGDGHNH